MPHFPYRCPGWLACASLLLLGARNALAEAELYGRLNLSLERQTAMAASQAVVADNASRIGFVETEQLGSAWSAGVHLEKGFDGSSGIPYGNGFDRMAELSIGTPNARLSIGRFGSTAYLAITDAVSLHNHDTGISSDALFAHVEPLGRKVGVSANAAGWSLQLVRWYADPGTGKGGGSAALLAYERPGLSLALSGGQDTLRYEHSARVLVSRSGVEFAAYVEQDRNVFGHGVRVARRVALAWHVGRSEWHVNEGVAGRYSGGEGGARQRTVAYNYNLSQRSKVYVLASRVRDEGTLYGSRRSTALGLRQNF